MYVVKYTYDAWGACERITDGNGSNVAHNASHLANINPFRYKGYYYDNETWFYYLYSRYYDPNYSRFVNADGTVNTETGVIGYNMFTYCNNEPIAYCDPTGRIARDAFKDSVAGVVAIGIVIAAANGIGSSNSDSAFEDLGKSLLYAAGIGFLLSSLLDPAPAKKPETIDRTAEAQTARAERTQARAEAKAETKNKNRNQAYFPVDPYEFLPQGLELKERQGTTNGRIFQWIDPLTSDIIFEWDEDFNYGSHYHILEPLQIDIKGKRVHYWPGEIVPEPWNSAYFGGNNG